jgi:deoxycytidine triphosphate deaminase
MDRTLQADEIESCSASSQHEPLLRPFCKESLKASSYDIRVGDTAVKSLAPQEQRHGKKYQYIDLKRDKSVEIEPGQSYTFYSLEQVFVPPDVQGLLLNRHHWVTKRLNFDGGVIEPTYKGVLFLTVTNVGDSPVSVNHGEPLVSAVFTRLESATKRKPYELRLELDEARLPPPPAGIRLDAIELSKRIKCVEEKLKQLEPKVQLVESFHQLVIYAVVAGIILALSNKFISDETFQRTFNWQTKFPYLLSISLVLFLFWLLWRRVRPRS